MLRISVRLTDLLLLESFFLKHWYNIRFQPVLWTCPDSTLNGPDAGWDHHSLASHGIKLPGFINLVNDLNLVVAICCPPQLLLDYKILHHIYHMCYCKELQLWFWGHDLKNLPIWDFKCASKPVLEPAFCTTRTGETWAQSSSWCSEGCPGLGKDVLYAPRHSFIPGFAVWWLGCQECCIVTHAQPCSPITLL